MIKKPTLPPVDGYVEIEENGIRRYKCIQTGEITDTPSNVTEIDRLRADIDFILVLNGLEVET